MTRIKYFTLNFLILILFSADRVLKHLFLKNPASEFGGDFFYQLLTFHLATNPGIAFGILVHRLILSVLIVAILIILVNFLIKAYWKKELISIFSLSLITAGAFSNLIDRLRYGFVVDYIDLRFFTVFNLADTMITLGIVFLVFRVFRGQKI